MANRFIRAILAINNEGASQPSTFSPIVKVCEVIAWVPGWVFFKDKSFDIGHRDLAVELSEQSRNLIGELHSKFEDVSQVGTQFVHTLLVVEMGVELFLRNVARCLREDDAQGTFGDRGMGNGPG